MEHKSSKYGLFITFQFMESISDKLTKGSEFKVMFKLLRYMSWKTGLSYPRMSRIARETNLSYRCVFDAITSLEEKGILTKTKQKMGADTDFYNNVYKIHGWDSTKITVSEDTIEGRI